MQDGHFADPELAGLYDLFSAFEDRRDFGFYLPMVMSTSSVLDVGCGTGALLHRARELGHKGRLCGVDPALGMLARARRRTDIEWVTADASSVAFDSDFGLAVMTGHAFQELVDDEELRSALTAIRKALVPGGRFAFETRNPEVRPWERWPQQYSGEVTDASGAVVRSVCEVEEPVTGDIVSFTHAFTSPKWTEPRVSRSTLRFLDAGSLVPFLAEAGLVVDEQFGDWDRSPPTDKSPEIITIARKP